MDFIFWATLVLGIVFTLCAVAIFVLECLVEKSKPAAQRSFREACRRFWEGTGRALVGGVLMILIAVALYDPELGFRLAFIPLGTVGAILPIVHLVASLKAEKENKPDEERQWWQTVSDKSGELMTWCGYTAIIIAAVYSFYSVHSTVEETKAKVKALEDKVEAMSDKLKS